MGLHTSKEQVIGKTILPYMADELWIKVQNIDLTPIKFKLTKELGWTEDKTNRVEPLYKAFFYLTAKHPERMFVPTTDIDDMWHTHILDTRKYIADCDAVHGHYLHHYPYLGLNGEADKANQLALYAETQNMYAELGLSIHATEVAGCGGGCGSSCGSSCSSSPSSCGSPSSCSSKPSSCSTPAPVIIPACGSSPSEPSRRSPLTPSKPKKPEKPKRKPIWPFRKEAASAVEDHQTSTTLH